MHHVKNFPHTKNSLTINDIYYLHRKACLNSVKVAPIAYREPYSLTGRGIPLRVATLVIMSRKVFPYRYSNILDNNNYDILHPKINYEIVQTQY